MRRFACTLGSLGLVLSLHLTGCDDPAEPSQAPPSTTAETAADPFVAVSEDVLREQIQAALARARDGGKRVLLEFVADWCTDCREVVRVASAGPAAEVLASDYEVIYVEVGRFDRHVELIQRYRIDRIATLVVLDARGARVAQTTLEPLSNRRPLSSEALAGWLREPVDHWQNTRAEPSEGDPPVFPAEIVEPN